MELEKIQIKDLPQELIERTSRSIKSYSIGLVGVAKGEACEKGNLFGSGTLIRIENTFGILTAYHVVDSKRLSSWTDIGFAFFEGVHSPKVPRRYLQIIKVAIPEEDSRGPDLAVMIVPEDVLGWMKAKKLFWNISPKRLEDPLTNLESSNGLWCVCGFVAEYTKEEGPKCGYANVKRFTGVTGCSGIERAWNDGQHDYFDLSVLYKDENELPTDFRGVSGGGLWKIPLSRNEDGVITAQEPILAGVAFYQTAVEGKKRSIRCHGPRSIYQMVYQVMKG